MIELYLGIYVATKEDLGFRVLGLDGALVVPMCPYRSEDCRISDQIHDPMVQQV